MTDEKLMRAIGCVLARTAQQQAADASDDELIDFAPLLLKWQAGSFAAGDVRQFGGAPYRCIQAHDSLLNPSWNPAAVPALWSPCHGGDAQHALAYAAPTHAGDAYQSGECMIWHDGTVYRCVRDATVQGPDALPDAWEALAG